MTHKDTQTLTSPLISALLIVSLFLFAFSVTAIQSSLSSSIEPCAQGGAGWKVMGKNGTESGGGGGGGGLPSVTVFVVVNECVFAKWVEQVV